VLVAAIFAVLPARDIVTLFCTEIGANGDTLFLRAL
jgi:hypothetical protein